MFSNAGKLWILLFCLVFVQRVGLKLGKPKLNGVVYVYIYIGKATFWYMDADSLYSATQSLVHRTSARSQRPVGPVLLGQE
jgi:hypothetical protein